MQSKMQALKPHKKSPFKQNGQGQGFISKAESVCFQPPITVKFELPL